MNIPVNSQQMEAFKLNPYNGKTIGGLNGEVPNRRDRRSTSKYGTKKISSTKVPKGSPYRLVYIKNMNLKAAIEKYSIEATSEASPKANGIKLKIKAIRSIRELKQSKLGDNGKVPNN